MVDFLIINNWGFDFFNCLCYVVFGFGWISSIVKVMILLKLMIWWRKYGEIGICRYLWYRDLIKDELKKVFLLILIVDEDDGLM